MRRMLYLLTLLTIPVSTHAAPDPSRVRPEEKPLLVLDTGGHTAPIVKLLFTPDSTKLISVGQDSTVQLWTVDTSERLRVLRPPAPTLKTAALSADGQTLAVGGVPHTFALTATYPIFLINRPTGGLTRCLLSHARSPPWLSPPTASAWPWARSPRKTRSRRPQGRPIRP